MNKNPCSLHLFSIVAIALVLGFYAQDSSAAPAAKERSPEQLQRIQHVKEVVGVHRRNARQMMKNRDVLSSGIGLDAKGRPVIKVLVANKDTVVPETIEGVRVHKEVGARIVALRGATCESSGNLSCATAERWPLPVPIGVSIGHPAVTAGTIGARVTDGSNVFILSNNHVIAALNDAILGDGIIQPGAFDGGVVSDDDIATLTDFQPLDFVGDNLIDAGIALTTTSELGTATPTGQFGSILGYGAPSPALHPAYGDPDIIGDEDLALLLGTAVQKVGRTTGITMGSVTTINATVSVCYDAPTCTKLATFVDQIIIEPGGFSGGGDSGSLIVTDDPLLQGVGLLFAGNGSITIANRIDHVLTRFGVSIDDGLNGNLRPVASFATNPVAGTLTIDLDASGSSDPDGSIVSYNWDFGDGSSGTGVAPSHTYAGPGSFTVRLTVTDDLGATSTATQTVVLDPIPGAVCLNATCDNTDTGFSSTGAWIVSSSSPGFYGSNYLHDGKSGKGTKTASWRYAIAEDGNYQVAAQWAEWRNRAIAVQYTYSVDDGPAQNCGAPANQQYNGGQLNNLCIVPGLTAGSTLTISLRNDAADYVIADAVRVESTLGGPLPPVAAFSADPVAGTLTIDFDGSASNDPDGVIGQYDWDFGDGTTGTGVAPSHTYASAGTYTVSLTVTGDFGATDQVSQTINLQPVGGGVCLAAICDNADIGFSSVGTWTVSTSSPDYYGTNYLHDGRSGKGSKTVSWTYDILADGNYEIAAHWSAGANRARDVQYMYSIDDGTPQACGTPADQRYNGGQFNSLCIVPTLAAGSSLAVSLRNDASDYVIVDAVRVEVALGGPAPPVAAFSSAQVSETLSVNFDASASEDPDGTIVAYDWDFGDGTFGSGVTPSHSYAVAGSYVVVLTVTGDFGATDQVTQTVTVQPPGGGVCPAAICDNTDSGFETVGVWKASSSNAGYYGSNYLHDARKGKGTKTASWTYTISADGNYEVAAQWSAYRNRARYVQYKYSVDGGPAQNCGSTVDQRYSGGQMNSLCTVSGLAAGSTFTVSLRNDSSSYVIADAVSVTLQ